MLNEILEKTDKTKGKTPTLIPYPIMCIYQICGVLLGTTIFTYPDLCIGYYHIGLDKESKTKKNSHHNPWQV